MTDGITRVTTSYDIIDDECIMSGTADYRVAFAGWHQIGACIPGTATGYAFSDQFEVKVGDSTTGTIDLYEIKVGHDFWQPGDKIDVTLLKSPYAFPGDIVGESKGITLEECETTTCSQSFTASADIGDLPFHPYFNMFKGTTFIGQYQTSASLTLDIGDTYMAEPLVPVGQEENWTAPDNVTFVACVGAINFEYTAIEPCPTPICSFRIN